MWQVMRKQKRQSVIALQTPTPLVSFFRKFADMQVIKLIENSTKAPTARTATQSNTFLHIYPFWGTNSIAPQELLGNIPDVSAFLSYHREREVSFQSKSACRSFTPNRLCITGYQVIC
jgi:hypothetical protein